MSAVRILFVSIVLGATYVAFTGQGLPDVLASHFSAGGQANGAMTRSTYLALMIGLLVLVPILIFLPTHLIRIVPLRFVRMPNKEAWLSPERREETLAFLSRQTAWFGSGLVVFLCFVHHLVVEANRVQPPRLPEQALIAGLLVFMAAVVAWSLTFVLRFARRP